jgi:hypothetical protein
MTRASGDVNGCYQATLVMDSKGPYSSRNVTKPLIEVILIAGFVPCLKGRLASGNNFECWYPVVDLYAQNLHKQGRLMRFRRHRRIFIRNCNQPGTAI